MKTQRMEENHVVMKGRSENFAEHSNVRLSKIPLWFCYNFDHVDMTP